MDERGFRVEILSARLYKLQYFGGRGKKKKENVPLYCKILESSDCDHKLIRRVR